MLKKHYTFEALGLVANGNDQLLSNITHLAARLLNADISMVSVMQQDHNAQYVSAAYGLAIETEEDRAIKFEQSVCKLVFDEKRLVVIPDLRKDPRTKNMDMVLHHGYRSYIGIPIHSVAGKTIGALCCVTRQVKKWTSVDIDSIERLGLEVDDIVISRAHAVELEITNTRIRKLLAARSSFTSHLSHEIRTPLTGLVGSVRLLNSMNLDGKAGQLVQVLNRSSINLLEIMDDTLYFAKLDAGQFKLNVEPVKVGQLAREILETFRAAADQKGILLDLDDQLAGLVHLADLRALHSVVQNLFSNAVKFTESGSVKITLAKTPYGLVEIKVIDTGIGIDTDALATIFEEFQQANPRIARKYGGTGLGMAIVKNLVQVMDGEIEVESKVGHGSTFTITLPLEVTSNVDLPEFVESV